MNNKKIMLTNSNINSPSTSCYPVLDILRILETRVKDADWKAKSVCTNKMIIIWKNYVSEILGW